MLRAWVPRHAKPVVHALQVVQGIKVLGANVRHREKERAERATLVTQERLVKGKVRESRPDHLHRHCRARLRMAPLLPSAKCFVSCHEC